MATNTKQIANLDIPFKEFMPGQVIQSVQFNDDMNDIEDKVNEIIGGHNLLSTEYSAHTDDKNNPHDVDAHQVGTYDTVEIDGFVEDIKNGGLYNNALENRVLADNCVDTRNYVDNSITVAKLEPTLGSQIDISTNMSITDRYTKTETDALIQAKVGDGTYDKATIDKKFEEVQAGQIVEGTIGIEKLKPTIGSELDISENPVFELYSTKVEVDNIINALPTKYAPLKINNEVFTLKEHYAGYVGSPRELTIDPRNNTIRVHDGSTMEGTRLASIDEVTRGDNTLIAYINDKFSNIAEAHNHDDLYSKLGHTHSEYLTKPLNTYNCLLMYKNGHFGLCNEYGDDDGWFRTTRNGLLPFQPGGYGSLGTNDWRFNEGHFNNVSAHTFNVRKNGNTSSINFDASSSDAGFIRHLETNDVAGMYFSASDNIDNTDAFYFGASPHGLFQSSASLTTAGDLWLARGLTQNNTTIDVGGRRIYFDGRRPSNAPEGSISFG